MKRALETWGAVKGAVQLTVDKPPVWTYVYVRFSKLGYHWEYLAAY